MGMQVVTNQWTSLRPAAEKLALLLPGTKGALLRGRASSLQLSRLIGVWVWMMSGVRGAMCLFDSVFAFVEAYRNDKAEHNLWEAVVDELTAVYYTAPLMQVNLSAPWATVVHATDACDSGYGVVATEATLEEVRAEASRELPTAVASQVGSPHLAEDSRLPDGHLELAERGLEIPEEVSDSARYFGDIFAGEGGFGAAVASHLGVAAVFVDTAISAKHDLTKAKNLHRMLGLISKQAFFACHFAPPCSSWSRARIPRLRRPGRFIAGLPNLRPKQKVKLMEGNALTNACVEMVRACLKHGVGFSVENPRQA